MKHVFVSYLLALLLFAGQLLARYVDYPVLSEVLLEGAILVLLVSLASTLLNYLAYRDEDVNEHQ